MPAPPSSELIPASSVHRSSAASLPLFDCNVSLGRSGQRQPGAFVDLPGLRATMAAHALDRALVYHAAAVRGDILAANQQLLADLAGSPDLHPCWAMLPPSAGEIGDPGSLVAEMLALGVRAVRCFPRSHFYQLRLRVLGELFEHLAAHRVPLFLDFEVAHWSERYIDWDGVDEICTAFPELPVILVRPGLMVDRDLYALLARHPQLYLETSYYFVHQGLRALADRFGARRMLFGTGMPTYAPGPPIATLTYNGLQHQEQVEVGSANLERLLEGVRP